MNEVCNALNDHLNGELSAAEEELFEQHLAACESCRSTVEQQRWIDALVRDASKTQPLPIELASIDLSPPVRTVKWWAAGAAAAAAILIAALVWRSHPTQMTADSHHALLVEADSIPTTPQAELLEEPKFTPVARLMAEDDVIVIPVDSGSPEVTIVQVYPTSSARSRWHREALLKESYFAHSGER